jgi:uncharacterized membrane protein
MILCNVRDSVLFTGVLQVFFFLRGKEFEASTCQFWVLLYTQIIQLLVKHVLWSPLLAYLN